MFKKTFLAVALISCSVASFAAELVFTSLPTDYSGTYAGKLLTGSSDTDRFPFNKPSNNDPSKLQLVQQLMVIGDQDKVFFNFSYATISNIPMLVIQYSGGHTTSNHPLAVKVASPFSPGTDYCIPAKSIGQTLNVPLSNQINIPLSISGTFYVSVTHGC
jgi:hypothetical protein